MQSIFFYSSFSLLSIDTFLNLKLVCVSSFNGSSNSLQSFIFFKKMFSLLLFYKNITRIIVQKLCYFMPPSKKGKHFTSLLPVCLSVCHLVGRSTKLPFILFAWNARTEIKFSMQIYHYTINAIFGFGYEWTIFDRVMSQLDLETFQLCSVSAFIFFEGCCS